MKMTFSVKFWFLNANKSSELCQRKESGRAPHNNNSIIMTITINMNYPDNSFIFTIDK